MQLCTSFSVATLQEKQKVEEAGLTMQADTWWITVIQESNNPILQFLGESSFDKKMAKSERNHEQIFQFWSRFEAVTTWRSALRSALASASWLK